MVPEGALGSHTLGWGGGEHPGGAMPTAPQAGAQEERGGGVLWSPELQQRQNAFFLNSVVN